jgi:phospho-N-acetylmuramoyl-pentapeptide-transferase
VLYHLFNSLAVNDSWLRVFRYQTFRAMLAFLFAFAFVLFFQPVFIRKLKSIGIKGQPIRDDGPKEHEQKRGTPTMGGVVVVTAVVLAALLFADLTNFYVWLTLFVFVSHAGIGFVDDWRKVTQQNSKGLSGPQKMFWQGSIAIIAALALMWYGFPTDLQFPFFKNWAIELNYWRFLPLFIPFVVLVVMGTSNAVNLTDGLDGLAIGPVMTVAVTYGIFAYLAGNASHSAYLGVQFVSGVGEVSLILAAVFAAGLGFLWYNTFPAQVFMGDSGALALGGLLGIVAILVKHEIVLVVAGGIFVIEALSVIIQRYSYKLRKKRVFKMAPIHHHFELKGWAEPKIIVRFWIISVVLAVLSLATLKLR